MPPTTHGQSLDPNNPRFFESNFMRSSHNGMLACLAQFLICVAGGFWAGNTADSEGLATAVGAFGMPFLLFTSYAAAQWVGMTLGVVQFARRAAKGKCSGPTPGDESGSRAGALADESRVNRSAVAVAIALLLAGCVPVAILVWLVAEDASFFSTLLRCLTIAAGAAVLMRRALLAVHG